MKYLFYFYFFLLFSLVACQKDQLKPEDNKPNLRPLSVSEKQTIQNNSNFAFNIFTKINQGEQENNFFISPLSISLAVTMAYNGANGTTKESIQNALALQNLSEDEINQACQSLSNYLSQIDKTVTFNPANSIWYRNSLSLQSDFVNLNQKYFNAEVKGLNFNDAENSKNTINNWVNDKTKGKIAKIIEEISGDVMMYLINAIYFKGTWTYQFDKNDTQNADFQLLNGTKKSVPFMKGKVKGNFYQDEDKVLVDLPYGNQQFSMTILMPSEGKSLNDLANQLTNNDLQNYLAKADTFGFELKMPKFKLEYKRELQTDLAKLGMSEAFTDNADFSRMIVGFKQGDLKISKVIHKTFIEVDEEGTEAAAVTAVEIVLTTVNVSPQPRLITLNRPFIFLIREKDSNAILFMGKMINP